MAPAGTPPTIIEALNAAFQTVLAEPAVRQRIIDIGAVPVGGSAAEATVGLREETARLGALIHESGITPD